MEVNVDDISENAFCTMDAALLPSLAKCRIRPRLTEKKAISEPEQKAESNSDKIDAANRARIIKIELCMNW
jgi:hypothetical protein